MTKRTKTQETQTPLLPQSILTTQNLQTGEWNVIINFGENVEPDVETFSTMDEAFARAAVLTDEHFPVVAESEPVTDESAVTTEA